MKLWHVFKPKHLRKGVTWELYGIYCEKSSACATMLGEDIANFRVFEVDATEIPVQANLSAMFKEETS